ncbi:MAG TPA: ornithine cyclodeaminase family protein [Dehalococcoidia bacterium]|nr:ornithine cyclodeaminase family protein [Dehalococcoidia bacterium]
MSTLLLSRGDVAELLNMEEVTGVLEQTFREHAAGRAQMVPKVYVKLEKGDFRAMPGAIPGAAGVKWVNVHLENRELGLPSIMGIFIYSDPNTGYPLAIMDATELTAYRTAATSAIASRYLARTDSRTMGLIGAGRQSYMHLESHARVFSLEEIKVYDMRPEAAVALISSFPRFNIKEASAEETAASDIVCTLTPATAPVVQASWVRLGTHIDAVGADAPGKQELDPALLRMARVVVDDVTQACHGGEINVAVSRGLFTKEQIQGTLGEVIAGIKPGREGDGDITIFDSTGLSIEDVATARLVYEKATERGGYPSIDIV